MSANIICLYNEPPFYANLKPNDPAFDPRKISKLFAHKLLVNYQLKRRQNLHRTIPNFEFAKKKRHNFLKTHTKWPLFSTKTYTECPLFSFSGWHILVTSTFQCTLGFSVTKYLSPLHIPSWSAAYQASNLSHFKPTFCIFFLLRWIENTKRNFTNCEILV